MCDKCEEWREEKETEARLRRGLTKNDVEGSRLVYKEFLWSGSG